MTAHLCEPTQKQNQLHTIFSVTRSRKKLTILIGLMLFQWNGFAAPNILIHKVDHFYLCQRDFALGVLVSLLVCVRDNSKTSYQIHL